MSRPIRFRVYDIQDQKMVIPHKLAKPSFGLDYRECRKKVSYPMQYIGLKDAEGIDIYEGDIVTNISGLRWVVKQDINSASFVFNRIKQGYNLSIQKDWIENTDCRVIGNIYEKPELLEKQIPNKKADMLKFRLWDKAKKKYISPFSIVLRLNGRLTDGSINVNDYYILEQYTGIKDENGVEMYVGDIIAANGMYNDQIIFEDGGFNLKGGDSGLNLLYQLQEYGGYKVIGNIHDNPELLDVKPARSLRIHSEDIE